MIFQVIFDMVKVLLNLIFSILPSIPNLPQSALDGIDTVLDLIFDNLGLLSFFVNISTIKIIIPIFIALMAFDKIYAFTMWVLKKIPMLGMK